MVANHGYTNPDLMFSSEPGDEAERLERLGIEMAAHGMSVVEVSRHGVRRPWEPVRDSRYNRRVHQQTALRMTGAAAGSEYLRTSQDPSGTLVHGTVNNCAGGTIPWGTVLSGEENFQGYFKRNPGLDPRNAVYGIGGGRGWEAVEPGWDLANEANEVNRFGWIVEPDPYDPTSTPASTRGSDGSSTRAPPSASPRTAAPSPSWGTTRAGSTSTSSSAARPSARG